MTDFAMSGQGSIYLLRPETDAAQTHAAAHFGDDTLWLGDAVAVEHRYAQEIAGRLLQEGFSIALDGKPLTLGMH